MREGSWLGAESPWGGSCHNLEGEEGWDQVVIRSMVRRNQILDTF